MGGGTLSAVELRGLVKSFGSTVSAVRGVDLAIGAGERFVVVGPSGSGKSTLLRLVAGLDAPDAGEVRIGGRSMAGVAPRDRGVGLVFQTPALYPHLSVLENLEFGLRARRVSAAERREQVDRAAHWLGLADLLERRPGGLSGGERQRVAIGRAVATRPSVLLLDEPFSGLDAPLRASTRAALLDLHREARFTLILVTHDQDDATAVGDRVALLRRGGIEQVGTPTELHDRPANRFVAGFFGEPPMALLRCEIRPGGVGVGIAGTSAVLTIRSLPGGVTSAWLGLRAEAVAVGAMAGPDAATVSGRIDRVEARGVESIARLRVGDHRLTARVTPGFPGREGDEVTIGLDLARASWFADDERGGRIGHR